MDHFNTVRSELDELPYMHHPQAFLLRDFVVDHDITDVIEIGFYHGKSSAYFAAIFLKTVVADISRLSIWKALGVVSRTSSKCYRPSI